MLEATPVIVLAGGLGTRLRPAVPNLPKALAPIGSCSFLEILIRLLKEQGARHFVLCVGHKAEMIEQSLGEGAKWGVRIDYSSEGPRPLGTAGALRLAERYFTPNALVLNGDTYFDIDYEGFLKLHASYREKHQSIATLALSSKGVLEDSGGVELDLNDNLILAFHEKSSCVRSGSTWVNSGVYILEHEFIKQIPKSKASSLEKEIFPGLIKENFVLTGKVYQEPFYDIGTPASWAQFAHFFQQRPNRGDKP